MDWSSDGKWIAAVVSRKDGTGQIALVGATSGAFTVLKTVPWKGPDRVFFSPDSRFIAYDLPASETSPQRDVFVMAIDDRREVPAIVHAASENVVGWSPDGRQLLFSSDRTGSVGLWAQPITGGKPVGPAEMLKADIGAVISLGLTTEGTLYGYKSVGSRDVRVAGIDLDAGRLHGDPRGFTQGFVAGATVPDWSPDGRFLAYQGCGDRDCVAIRSVETGQVRTLQRGLLFTTKSALVAGRPGADCRGPRSARAKRDLSHRCPDGRIHQRRLRPGVSGPAPVVARRREDLLRARRRDRTRPDDRDQSSASSASGESQSARHLARRPVSRARRCGVSTTGRVDFFKSSRPVAASRESCSVWRKARSGGPPARWRGRPTVVPLIVLKATSARKELWMVPIDGASPRRLDIDADSLHARR